jgi:hypothetical protein
MGEDSLFRLIAAIICPFVSISQVVEKIPWASRPAFWKWVKSQCCPRKIAQSRRKPSAEISA